MHIIRLRLASSLQKQYEFSTKNRVQKLDTNFSSAKSYQVLFLCVIWKYCTLCCTSAKLLCQFMTFECNSTNKTLYTNNITALTAHGITTCKKLESCTIAIHFQSFSVAAPSLTLGVCPTNEYFRLKALITPLTLIYLFQLLYLFDPSCV